MLSSFRVPERMGIEEVPALCNRLAHVISFSPYSNPRKLALLLLSHFSYGILREVK